MKKKSKENGIIFHMIPNCLFMMIQIAILVLFLFILSFIVAVFVCRVELEQDRNNLTAVKVPLSRKSGQKFLILDTGSIVNNFVLETRLPSKKKFKM